MGLRDLFLKSLYARFLKLNNRLAFHTDQMIMMGVTVVGEFVPREAIAKAPLMRNIAFGQEFQRPIDGRVANLGILLSNFREKFFDAYVVRHPEEGIDDEAPLIGRAQPFLRHVRGEEGPKMFEVAFGVGHGAGTVACSCRGTNDTSSRRTLLASLNREKVHFPGEHTPLEKR